VISFNEHRGFMEEPFLTAMLPSGLPVYNYDVLNVVIAFVDCLNHDNRRQSDCRDASICERCNVFHDALTPYSEDLPPSYDGPLSKFERWALDGCEPYELIAVHEGEVAIAEHGLVKIRDEYFYFNGSRDVFYRLGRCTKEVLDHLWEIEVEEFNHLPTIDILDVERDGHDVLFQHCMPKRVKHSAGPTELDSFGDSSNCDDEEETTPTSDSPHQDHSSTVSNEGEFIIHHPLAILITPVSAIRR
jgi:hypothetical protein